MGLTFTPVDKHPPRAKREGIWGDFGEGFGEDNASGWLLGDGLQQRVPLTSKLALAHDLLDALAPRTTPIAALATKASADDSSIVKRSAGSPLSLRF